MHTLTKKEIPKAIKILKEVKKRIRNKTTKQSCFICHAIEHVCTQKNTYSKWYTIGLKLKQWIMNQLKGFRNYQYHTLEKWIFYTLPGYSLLELYEDHKRQKTTRLAWINSMIKQLQGELK